MKRCMCAVVALTALSGCGFDFGTFFGWSEPETEAARLRQFQSEDELKAYLVSQNQSNFYDDFFFGDGDSLAVEDSAGAPTAAPEPSPNGGAEGGPQDAGDGDRSFSTTTEQEEGVQESDIIKNDGEYLYVLSRGVLRIVKATPSDAMTEVGSIDLEGYGMELYLVGDQAVAITSPNSFRTFGPMIAIDEAMAGDFAYYRPQAEVSVIDLTDRTNPVVVSRAVIDGSIHASRMIDSRLYLVAVNYPDIYAEPLLLRDAPVDGTSTGTSTAGAPEPAPGPDMAAKTLAFEDLTLTDLLPDIAIEVGGEIVYAGDIATFEEHFRPVDPDGLGLTSIVSLDINAPADYEAQTVVAYPANVYASTQAIYMTDTQYNFRGAMRETTDVYKFALTETGVVQTAAGTVKGRVLDQYSMSEYEGFFRIATTISADFGPFDQTTPSTNNVYVLEQDGEELKVAGSIEGLAPGESIFSARFLGPRGYIVTFEQIDPLFTLDLSDPRDPKAVGELKVPGFSTFILPMDNDHLLTIGRDTNEDFGFAEGIRVSIFDVSDFANPQLAHFEVIGDTGGWSEALYNPKAFTYFAEGEMLAFPVEIYGYNGVLEDFDGVVDVDDGGMQSGGSDGDPVPAASTNGVDDAGTNGQGGVGTNGTEPAPPPGDDPVVIDLPPPPPSDSFYGLYVYHVTAADGFELMGRISTRSADNPYGYSEFIRGAFIGNAVYAVTSESVQSADVSDVETVLSTVAFPVPEFDVPEGPKPTEPGSEPSDDMTDADSTDPAPTPMDDEG